MSDRDSLDSMTVNQLKDELTSIGLSKSGKKAELVERLKPYYVVKEEVLATSFWKKTAVGPLNVGQSIGSLFVVSLLLIVVFNPSLIGLGENEPVYEPIDFDASQVRWYAEELVALGHPEWEGRMSGSPEEAAAAEMILDNLTAMGYSPQLNTYPVPMFAINSAPVIAMCIPTIGFLTGPSCNSGFGAQITTFEHRSDYVIQGYSGSADIQFGQNMELIDLDDGTDDSLWSSASGKVGIIRGGGNIDGNTGMYIKAAENSLAGLFRINNQTNCGQIEADDCVPIFKSIRVDDMKAANSGSIPEDIPFMAVSNQTGNEMLELAEQGAVLR